MNILVSELADLLAARLLTGGPDTMITGFASLKEAQSGDLSFFSDSRYQQRLQDTRAAAVLVPADWSAIPVNVACLAVADPSAAFEKVVDTYGFHTSPFQPGIHASAVMGSCINTDMQRISVAANAVIEDGVQIGNETQIGAGCFVGRSVRIGNNCKLFTNATVHEGCVLGDNVILHSSSVIGADGFGYEFQKGRHRKVRQSGIVQIDNDVEIGAGSAVDRARFGRTWIGEGTKIDNLVQIGHNVVIGKHCIIVAGTGIAGSALIGDYVVIAAQSGVAGHVSVGSQCTLGGRSGVTKDLPAGPMTYLGFPAVLAKEEMRRAAAARRLPQLLERVRKLEKILKIKDGAP
ncbi:MAG: UDP-3-O-(3-hydroxymyristoyl)glucosamine N-acyltransferase [Verrucomicrobiaceae bacterium]